MVALGYLRVSTKHQLVDTGMVGINEYANKNNLGEVIYYKDPIVSGNKPFKQRKIYNLLKDAKVGDWLLVTEISRLSRCSEDNNDIMKMIKKKKLNLHAVKDCYTYKYGVDQSDSDFIQLTILIMAAQLERNKISQRVKQGIKVAREKGLRVGNDNVNRKKNHDNIIADYRSGMSEVEISQKYDLSYDIIRYHTGRLIEKWWRTKD